MKVKVQRIHLHSNPLPPAGKTTDKKERIRREEIGSVPRKWLGRHKVLVSLLRVLSAQPFRHAINLLLHLPLPFAARDAGRKRERGKGGDSMLGAVNCRLKPKETNDSSQRLLQHLATGSFRASPFPAKCGFLS